MTQSFALAPASHISHYEVEKRIGAGGMGEVYLAKDLTLERMVALKVLPPSLLGDPDRVRRFVQEAKSASALNHPNIVTIYEIGQARLDREETEEEPTVVHYMAMEFIDGRTLRSMIEGGTPLPELLRVLAQAADGLAKAHDAGIVHRDLKPDNIMVSNDGFAKVVDFGLAKLTESKDGAQQKGLTQTGMVMGTLGYMSPEQVGGDVVLPPSDIFAFGCILYECATRKRPFESDLAIDTLHKIMFSEPMPVMAYLSDASPRIQPLIDACLKKKPSERPKSMREIASTLRELAGLGSGPVAASQAPATVMLTPEAFPSPTSSPRIPSGSMSAPVSSPSPSYAPPAHTSAPHRRIEVGNIFGTLVRLALLAAVVVGGYVWFTMPNVSTLRETNPPAEEWTEYSRFAPTVRRAVVAAVDPLFYDRRAIDPKKLTEAIPSLTKPERALYAPSQMTRTIAKQIYPTPAWNPAAPVRTWAVASSMERHLSRQRILEIYLNLAQFGDSVGANDAARKYFKKSPARLTENEAVLLAASLTVAPFDPENPSSDVTATRASILEQLPKIGGDRSPEREAPAQKPAAKPKSERRSERRIEREEPPVETPPPAAESSEAAVSETPASEESEPPAETTTTEPPPASASTDG